MSAKISLGALGVNGAVSSRRKQHRVPPRRGKIIGWTQNAARRNKRFLQSVEPDDLSGFGMAFTLTVSKCPESPEAWTRALNLILKRFRRWGSIRFHWVIEWQKRGHPHFHGIVYFDDDVAREIFVSRCSPEHWDSARYYWPVWRKTYGHLELERAWTCLENGVAGQWGASWEGQHIEFITNISGWAQYLSKHASRGADHYQRQKDNLPKGWKSSGRLWAKGGDWPTYEVSVVADMRTFWRFRRALRRWYVFKGQNLIAKGKRYNNDNQIKSGESLLRLVRNAGRGKSSPNHSRVKGFSAHMDIKTSSRLLVWAADHPYSNVSDWLKTRPPKNAD